MFRPVASLACALLVTGAVASQADAARLFFSTQPLTNMGTTAADRTAGVPTIGNPTINIDQGAQGSLFLWVEMNSDDGISGLALTGKTSAAGVVSAASFSLPLSFTYYDANAEEDITFTRWQGSSSGTLNSDANTLWLNSNAVFVGAPNVNYSSTTDPTRKNTGTGSRSFYLGELKLNGLTEGTTEIRLAVGQATISGVGLSGDLFFGTGDTAISGNGTVVGSTSTTADATIHVNAIPEPASLGLLAIGGLMMVARRRRA